jgi:ribosomal protein S18 acetylase RimI-like enzyme
MNEHDLRPAGRADAGAMLALLRSVSMEGDTLPFRDAIDADFIDSQWLGAAGCFLAWQNGVLLGMYRYGPNMPGRGSHVATATFIVAQAFRGRGLGRTLVRHCLARARGSGFRAMQFNQVVATNLAALSLYRSLGFTKVGEIPEAFAHPEHGYVAAYVMHRELCQPHHSRPNCGFGRVM